MRGEIIIKKNIRRILSKGLRINYSSNFYQMAHENEAVNFENMMMHIDILVQTRYNIDRTLALSRLGGYTKVYWIRDQPRLISYFFSYG